MKTTPTLHLAEYQAFSQADIARRLGDRKDKAPKIWKALESFARQEGNHQFLRFSGNSLKTQNHVGLIQVKGFCIEILPKICGRDLNDHVGCKKQMAQFDRLKFQEQVREFIKPETNLAPQEPPCPLCHAKQVLYNCLTTLKNAPFKQSQFSHLSNAHLPLLDVFVQMFLEECAQLIKQGLKRDYLAISKNRPFLKGKLEFASHLRVNMIHKERFYTTSDEYSLDNPPNRLIKAALEFFKTLSLSPKSQEKLNAVRFVFDEVRASKGKDMNTDFGKHATRFKEYENLLAWCDLFLRKKSLTPYSGSDLAYALLFPMEKLFESFVGYWLQKSLGEYRVYLQECKKFLMQDEWCRGVSLLRPDIVLKNKEEVLILDTKWKIEDASTADLYQMWAYASKYAFLESKGRQRRMGVWLVYPWQDRIKSATYTFNANQDIALQIKYFPLDKG
ncbi:McrC family protein [Helicobacter vulpis]|uniref:McrC family protein n=1 Tax=Helicobacter vulpis TaxID=2316076 RepID=UPI000EB08EBC|nr:restriction endonuclease [Helicobacter vulpis]